MAGGPPLGAQLGEDVAVIPKQEIDTNVFGWWGETEANDPAARWFLPLRSEVGAVEPE